MSFILYLTYYLFITIAVLLMLLILLQKGRGGGLSGEFGGGGGNTAFGSKTGDVLTWATSILFGVFILLAVVFNLVANKYNDRMYPPKTAAAASTPADAPAGSSVPPGSTDPGVAPKSPK